MDIIKIYNLIVKLLPFINITLIIFFIISMINLVMVITGKNHRYLPYSIYSFIISIALLVGIYYANVYFKKFQDILNQTTVYFNSIKDYLSTKVADVNTIVDQIKTIIMTNVKDYQNILSQIQQILDQNLSGYQDIINGVLDNVKKIISLITSTV